jgi:hypothetical protein
MAKTLLLGSDHLDPDAEWAGYLAGIGRDLGRVLGDPQHEGSRLNELNSSVGRKVSEHAIEAVEAGLGLVPPVVALEAEEATGVEGLHDAFEGHRSSELAVRLGGAAPQHDDDSYYESDDDGGQANNPSDG